MLLPEKSFAELHERASRYLAANTKLIGLVNGGIATTVVDSVLIEIAKLYNSVNAMTKQAFLSTAEGYYLDLLGRGLFGISRTPNLPGIVDKEDRILKFYVNSSTLKPYLPGGIVPEGVIIRNADSTIRYLTTENIPVLDTDTEVYVSAVSIGSGTSVNAKKNTLTAHNLDSNILCTNVEDIITAKNVESDKEYRARLIEWSVSARSGNIISLRAALLTITGISDAIFVSNTFGPGTYSVTLIPTSNRLTGIAKAEAIAVLKDATSFGTSFVIYEPNYIPIKIAIKLTFKPSVNNITITNIKSAIQSQIRNLIANVPLGGKLSMMEIKRILFDYDEIKDFDIFCLKINHQLYRVADYTLGNNELFVLDDTEKIPVEII